MHGAGFRRSRSIAGSISTLLLVACAQSTSEPPAAVEVTSYEVLSLQNTMTGLETPTRSVIRDSVSWAAAWSAIYAHHAPGQVPPLPPIDFGTQMVLLAGAGTRGAQGFTFLIRQVTLQDGVLHVRVLEDYPHCGTLPALSAPVHAVRVARTAEEAVFTVIVRQPACP